MISDGDARQYFQGKQNMPCSYGNYSGSLQIQRGNSPLLWKDAHPGACARHFAVFNKFEVIPKYCFECYKVLVEPRTVVELFKLLIVMEKINLLNDNTRKVMVEGRVGITGAYKGYVYCRGLKEGGEVLDIVRQVVSDEISPDVHVVLKRGCSEFVLAHPAYSPKEPDAVIMEYDEDWQVHEDSLDRELGINRDDPVRKPDNVAPYSPAEIWAMCYWVRYAATIRDMSYLTLTGYPVLPLPELKRPPLEP